MSWSDLAANEAKGEQDWETCSWCTTEVLDAQLRPAKDGARICPDCRKDPKNKDFV